MIPLELGPEAGVPYNIFLMILPVPLIFFILPDMGIQGKMGLSDIEGEEGPLSIARTLLRDNLSIFNFVLLVVVVLQSSTGAFMTPPPHFKIYA